MATFDDATEELKAFSDALVSASDALKAMEDTASGATSADEAGDGEGRVAASRLDGGGGGGRGGGRTRGGGGLAASARRTGGDLLGRAFNFGVGAVTGGVRSGTTAASNLAARSAAVGSHFIPGLGQKVDAVDLAASRASSFASTAARFGTPLSEQGLKAQFEFERNLAAREVEATRQVTQLANDAKGDALKQTGNNPQDVLDKGSKIAGEAATKLLKEILEAVKGLATGGGN